MNDEFEEDLGVYFDSDEDFDLPAKNAVNDHEFAAPQSVEPEPTKSKSSKQQSTESESDWEKPSTSSSNTDNGSDFNFAGDLFYSGPEAEGFFIPSGNSFYYPTNFPVREYQKSIIETALFNNTLVVLPTGLGKTFIAAVVMYNFYRWYPQGLIVFMAPTRPLVTQQINACTDIMGIPVSDITEITGKSSKPMRMECWKEKRVFFLTPHVMVNDIVSNYCDPSRVRCIIFDEAHKAMGNYSYCQVVRQLKDYLLKFRIVALSATPGNNVEAYQEVIHNLNIAKIQVRSEDSPDVVKYIHGRKLSHIVLKLDGTWKQFHDKFLQLYEDYSRVLKDHSVVRGNICNLTAFQIRTLMESFKKKKDLTQDVKNKCNMSLLACSTLAHGNTLLYLYGFKALYSHFSGDSDSAAMPFIRKNDKLRNLLRAVEDYLKDNGSPDNYVPSHPKFIKLREVVANHFSSTEQKDGKNDSKVIIYCQFRIGVTEAHAALIELQPLIRPVMFIGQSSGKKGGGGIGQKVQLDILNNFKSGKYNTLIATSIGEEGLDIGEVDLIICLDAQSSITRHIQRIGRTGRKRAGACIFLVTEGKEEAKLQKCLSASSNFSKMVNPSLLNTSVTGANPRMVPKGIQPKLHFVHIKPNKDKADQKKTKAVAQGGDETNEEASTSKGAPKRKKAAGKNEEKKEKQSKKAKLENPPPGKTLFSYFTKKTFDSFNESDAETKEVFATPKDKQSKSKSKVPELNDIIEEDCVVVEEHFENNFENAAVPIFQGDTNTCHVDPLDAQEALFNDISATTANKSENRTDGEFMFSLFRNWVTNYAQNDDVLFDENFFQLVRLCMKKPSGPVPTIDCDPVNIPRSSSPIDYGINFDSSSDESESPEILSRKAPHSSPVKLETPIPADIESPILSCNKVKPMVSPFHFVTKDAHIGNESPFMPQSVNSVSTSTPKLLSKFRSGNCKDTQVSDEIGLNSSTPHKKFCSGAINVRNPSVLDRIGAELDIKKEIKIEDNCTSPPPNIDEDGDSTSPLILTCKISKPVNPGRSKQLFPDEPIKTEVVPVSECNIKQLKDEPHKSPMQHLSDSFDLFEGSFEDFPLSPTVGTKIPEKEETLPQKENNVPNFSPKVEVPQESISKPSLFTTVHSEKSKWLATQEKTTVKPKNLDSFETLASELEAFSKSKTAEYKSRTVCSSIPSIQNADVKNPVEKPIDSCKKQAGSTSIGNFLDYDDSLFDDYFVNSAIKLKNKKSKPTDSLNHFEPGLFSSVMTNKDLKSYKPIPIISSKIEKTDEDGAGGFGFLHRKTAPKSLSSKTSSNPKKSLFSTVKTESVRKELSERPKEKQDVSRIPPLNTENNNLFDDDFDVKDNKAITSKTERNPLHESNYLRKPDVSGVSKSEDFNTVNLIPNDIIKTSENNIGSSNTEKSVLKNHQVEVTNEHRKPTVSCVKFDDTIKFRDVLTSKYSKPNVSHAKFDDTINCREDVLTSKSNKSLHGNYVRKLENPVSTKSYSYTSKASDLNTNKSESKDLSPLFDSDDDLFFERPRPIKPKASEPKPPKRPMKTNSALILDKKSKKKRNDFIDWEAEVSGSDFSEDEHEGDDEDMSHMPDSFIHDGHHTVVGHEHTMTAQYLESVKSPPRAPGGFKIPVLPNRIEEDIFSQTFHNDADYQNDSFCVDEEISDYNCSEDEESFDRNPKKSSKKHSKRKRTIENSSSNEDIILITSSSEEETFNSAEEISLLSDGESPYTKKKPTRRKNSHSEKFSKLKKVIEAKKSKPKPTAEPFRGEPSCSSKKVVQQDRQQRRETRDSDSDYDNFLPKPSGSRANVGLKHSFMEMSVIGKKVKKKAKLNLFSSDED